jgi:hypothetical protein
MAVQNFAGDACRGATWVSLHNGGGVGWGEVINGGFGLVLDGTADGRPPPGPDAATGTSTTASPGAPGPATRAPSSPSGAAMELRPAAWRVTLGEHADDELIERTASDIFHD